MTQLETRLAKLEAARAAQFETWCAAVVSAMTAEDAAACIRAIEANLYPGQFEGSADDNAVADKLLNYSGGMR